MFIINTFSTCFGQHYAHLQENKTCVTACGVLRWFRWMWLVAVVGLCVVGCEHCEGYCSNSNLHSARTLQRSALSAWWVLKFFGMLYEKLEYYLNHKR